MKKIKLVSYLTWSCLNTFGMLLGAFSWKFTGNGWGLMIWSAVWELYVLHKIFQVLEER